MNNDVVYDASKNPDQATLPGVPLADFSAAQFEALPAWLKASVCACPFYTVPESLRPIGRTTADDEVNSDV